MVLVLLLYSSSTNHFSLISWKIAVDEIQIQLGSIYQVQHHRGKTPTQLKKRVALFNTDGIYAELNEIQ